MTGSMSSTPLGSLRDAQTAWAAPRPAVNAAQGRVEPRLDDAPVPPAVDWAHDEPEWKSSDGEAGGLPAYPLSHIAWMTSVFVIGTTLGLAAAWWLKKPVPAIIVPPLERHGAAPKTVQTKHPIMVRGIDPGELPYDGAPPPTDAGQARDTNAAIPVPDKSTNGALSSRSGVTPAKPAAKAAEPSQPDDGNATKATPRRAIPRRSVKDKEIERIKQQAADELKKD